MAPTLALRFLSLALLVFMNGCGIHGREMKVEMGDERQVDSYKASPGSNDKSYLTGYRTSSKPTQSNYIETHAHETNQPFIVYSSNHAKNPPKESSNDDTAHPYITQYLTTGSKKNAMGPERQVDSYEASPVSNDKSYLIGYRTHSKPTLSNYIASYTVPKHKHPSHHENLNQYGTNNQYGTSAASKANQPYIAQYGDRTHDSNAPYVVGYIKTPAHETSQLPFILHNSNHVISDAKNAPEESSHDDTAHPYMTQYGTTGSKKNAMESRIEAFKVGFFALDDLYVGNVMTLQFPVQEVSHFLPRKEADSIPFSTSQLPSLFQLFSIPQDSPQANAMRGTLEQCEAETITGETKTCVTSLESMLEFVANIIGSEPKYNILTTTYPTPSSIPLQKYTILEVSQDINAPKWVACHPLPYPYAVYYCHFIATGSKVFEVTLGGESGDNKIEALGICHLDTSDWSPDHILFKQLGFKPGEAPVCHFFPVNHLMWVQKSSEATM
ncbi:BURP domain-containing protein 11-like [Abrus precatorius]|uniref:BURP domain-containing protein 11-like n=1 Tax=Abrus precatorius TaxID=3816 RepID=A0A8B8LG87_ABRPR|nr:BURP domain-containing protein 11-like [Abrus precatorius]